MTVLEANERASAATATILIIDDDRIILDYLGEFLRLEGHDVHAAGSCDAARAVLQDNPVQIVITDLNMPEHDGLDVLRYIRRQHPEAVPIVITAFGSINSAVEAIKLGAYDYLTKPVVDDELRIAIERTLKQQALQAENLALRQQLQRRDGLGELVGRDRKMQRVFELIEAVGPTSTTVLVTGESGTGKSMVARALHRHGDRSDGPFVEVSCGALPESLLESELFGHLKGSFTGALADKQGRFLAADGGTIFLDEIDSATPALQVKLLRVLQERQFEPVGGNQTLDVDVRVVVATNKDLRKLVEQGTFRQDLYYRINVVGIALPPLRERLTDIRPLVEHFLARFRHEHQRPVDRIDAETYKRLERYSWPGNVRELENVIERAVVLARTQTIQPDDLPPEILAEIPASPSAAVSPAADLPFADALADAEKQIILRALDRHRWNRQATADALKISRTTLFRRMRDLGLSH